MNYDLIEVTLVIIRTATDYFVQSCELGHNP